MYDGGLAVIIEPYIQSDYQSGDETGRHRSVAWEAYFPQASINPSNKTAPAGGFGLYLRGPDEFAFRLKQENASEVIMSYEVMFEDGFAWALGGKLPGIYGGVGDEAYGCTGGRQTGRCQCFDLRHMWRADGLGELYAYIPSLECNTHRLLAIPPRSLENADYGFSAGRGAWRFRAGRWTTIAQRVKINNIGKEDGELQVFVDGQSIIHSTGLVFRTDHNPGARIQGLHLETFFGGSKPEWACPKDQRAWFTSISGAILQTSTTSNSAAVHDES